MDDKTLKKMKREELLELLLEERKRNEELESKLAKVTAELEEKRIRIRESGNLAEASLALTKVFEEAQKAAELYLENIKRRNAKRPGVIRDERHG